MLSAGPMKIVDGSPPLRTTRRGSVWPQMLAMRRVTSEWLRELTWLLALSSRGREGRQEMVLEFQDRQQDHQQCCLFPMPDGPLWLSTSKRKKEKILVCFETGDLW